MKLVTVDLSTNFDNVEGNTKVLNEKNQPVTLYEVLRFALAQDLKTDAEGTTAEITERKMNNFDLMVDLKTAGPDCKAFNLTPEQAKTLEARVALIFSIIVFGPVVKMLRNVTEVPPLALPDPA